MKKWLNSGRLDRIETSYLLALRIAGLVVATVCLIAALYFTGDALWRLAVPTNVKTEPTAVDTARMVSALAAPPKAQSANSDVPAAVKQAHDTFTKNVWPRYYAIYRTAFNAHKKPEDRLTPSNELMEALGYNLDIYSKALEAEGPEADRIVRLVNDAAYQEMAITKVKEVMTSPRVTQLLNQYKAAEKSEKRCVTTPRTQVVPATCGYYYVYDCSYTRTVNIERCESVYPDGIVSPVQAFERADRIFADTYFEDEAAKAGKAAAERSERLEIRSKISPLLKLALSILASFFVVMFFFLIIAIERHLRRIAQTD